MVQAFRDEEGKCNWNKKHCCTNREVISMAQCCPSSYIERPNKRCLYPSLFWSTFDLGQKCNWNKKHCLYREVLQWLSFVVPLFYPKRAVRIDSYYVDIRHWFVYTLRVATSTTCRYRRLGPVCKLTRYFEK